MTSLPAAATDAAAELKKFEAPEAETRLLRLESTVAKADESLFRTPAGVFAALSLSYALRIFLSAVSVSYQPESVAFLSSVATAEL